MLKNILVCYRPAVLHPATAKSLNSDKSKIKLNVQQYNSQISQGQCLSRNIAEQQTTAQEMVMS
jgi:hypothetical protein